MTDPDLRSKLLDLYSQRAPESEGGGKLSNIFGSSGSGGIGAALPMLGNLVGGGGPWGMAIGMLAHMFTDIYKQEKANKAYRNRAK